MVMPQLWVGEAPAGRLSRDGALPLPGQPGKQPAYCCHHEAPETRAISDLLGASGSRATRGALSQTASDEAMQSATDMPETREKHFFHFELVLSHEKVTVQSQKTELRFPNPRETDADRV